MDGTVIFNFVREILIWTAIGILAYFVLFRWLRGLAGRTRFDADNIVLRIVRIPLISGIIAYGFVSAFRELKLSEPYPTVITNIYVVILIAATMFFIWRIISEVILRWLTNRATETETRLDDLVVPLVGTVGPLFFFLITIVAILQYLGVDVAVLATSVGIIGLVIGLAFQDSLSNLFSGIYLMIDPAFLENDLIRIDDDKVFSVEKVGLRMTRLYDMDSHASIFVPNNNIAKARIANITKPTIDMKAKLHVTVPCETDADKATEIIRDVIVSHRNTLDTNADQLAVLRKRLERSAPPDSERASSLFATASQLEQWLDSDAGNDAAHANLHAVRREMSDRLADAQAAIHALPRLKVSGRQLDRLRDTLAQVDTGPEMEEIDQNRMARIYNAFSAVKSRLNPAEAAPIQLALDRLDELERLEQDLEVNIDQAEQARESELDRLLSTLVWTGDWLAEEMISMGQVKEGNRVSLWVRNTAAVYAYSEVEESLNGLDREIGSIIDWLQELEAGGLTKLERARVRSLFGAWGGLRQMEKRRVNELRRRIFRWLEWKEKNVLDASDYARLSALWERRLRTLSRKLPDTGTDDEESLDGRLVATRKWMHSVSFIERLDEWKLPTVELKSFDGTKLDYTVTFYIDDIKQQHFERQHYVKSDILTDLYESCQRAGIASPVASSE
jgi:MscS family membrane protein